MTWQRSIPKKIHETIAVLVLQNTYDFIISHCCFAKEGEEIDRDSKRTCRTRCRRRGLPKLPNKHFKGLLD